MNNSARVIRYDTDLGLTQPQTELVSDHYPVAIALELPGDGSLGAPATTRAPVRAEPHSYLDYASFLVRELARFDNFGSYMQNILAS